MVATMRMRSASLSMDALAAACLGAWAVVCRASRDAPWVLMMLLSCAGAGMADMPPRANGRS